MKTIFLSFFVLLLVTACNKEEPINPDPVPDTPLETRETGVSYAPVVDPIHGNQVIGQAKLIRQAHGLTMQYRTGGLEPGHTYTIWWIVWNKPENCVGYPGPCDAPDFEIADEVEVEIMYAAGQLADAHGEASFSGHLHTNDASDSINDLFELPSFGGLKDPAGAEVHLVLRSHGPAIPGQVHDQISSYQGGCTTYLPDFSEVPDEAGECADLHFAVFQTE